MTRLFPARVMVVVAALAVGSAILSVAIACTGHAEVGTEGGEHGGGDGG